MYLTWLDSNSWLIEMAGQRILLDPWLVGPLVFGNAAWFFKGVRRHPKPIPDNIDLILLSQGLPDHAHPPTLAQLERSIPVVGSPGAAKVAQDLDYTQVTALDHGETFTVGALQIQAFPGAPIGPLLVENAYILKDVNENRSLYYEPHGYHAPELQGSGPVDVVIAPIEDLKLPLVGSFIRGGKVTLDLVKQLQPKVVLPTTTGGDIEYSGLLNTLLSSKGGIEDFNKLLSQHECSAQILAPTPGKRFEVPLPQENTTVNQSQVFYNTR